MSEELYISASSFSTYEEIINKDNDDINVVINKPCDFSKLGECCKNKDFHRNCLIADKYLNYLESGKTLLNIEEACKYFSYWIYKEMLLDKEYSNSVSEVYEIITKNKDVHICKEYVEDIIPPTFSNIKKLIGLYENLMKILTGIKDIDCDQAKICIDMYKGFEGTFS
ncbi:hypothetical protein PVNG_03855 [Plasmodium vivax North Korean]|uniref:Variable surface protein n=1 Tax=Plasmodium vivax North Korean TaxID=1035514 RepID=A0A0J9TUI8_PLAVI|nr:hypothetical protein PVNG_03855 [Plasmodium vivax North Korean]